MYTSWTISAVTGDIQMAHVAEHGVRSWFTSVWRSAPQPLASEAWVFTPDFERLLVVQHRWRGLVAPGGKVEADETPREAAVRELGGEPGQPARWIGLSPRWSTHHGADATMIAEFARQQCSSARGAGGS